MTELSVFRRIPTYDFTIRTRHSVEDNKKTLEAFLRGQTRPRGFVLFSPVVSGTVSGSEFELYPPEAALHGSTPPHADGYFVPDACGGSHVVVRVQNSRFVYGFVALTLIFGAVTLFRQASLENLVMFSWFVVLGFLVSVGPVVLEGVRLSKTLLKLFTQTRLTTVEPGRGAQHGVSSWYNSGAAP